MIIPSWIEALDSSDLSFIKRFLLCSGSIKKMAESYGVSYPTMRIRLNRLIEKIEISSQEEVDPFIAHVKRMAVDEKIDIGAAAELVDAYRTYSNIGVRTKHEA